MSNTPKPNDELSQLKRALAALKEMRSRLEAVEEAKSEPIAIIGMGCRFPGGANSPEAFWQLLQNGVDAISEVPADRWAIDSLYDPDPTVPGKMNTRYGGFIEQVDQFDPSFFGISPREAARMDPQQRLLLETAWEALEAAGQTLEGLAGSQTGVFVGIHSHSCDYTWFQFTEPLEMDVYTGTGTAHNVVSGRLSYLFDLQGPSVAVDTACSSSLVATHLAVQSLRLGECRMALAAGVNLILSPLFTVAATRMQMLAPDGRCKAFDAQADGFVRSEGCGVVVLKRLSEALADGDPILAVVRGSAINQDGRTNGLTAPNSLSQEAVIRQALENARVRPEQITYIEAHGTGTPLGDPIEVEALASVLSPSNLERQPCALGSAKANIGHLEGAAGIAGVIKAVLSLQHQAVPPLAHFKTLNPHISLENSSLIIPTALQPWSTNGEKRYAGVSAFGWSGTNVHVILEEAPQPVPTPQVEDTAQANPTYLLPLAAHTSEALKAMAQAYRQFLASDDDFRLKDICHRAGVRRSHHDYRLAVTGASKAEMIEHLTAFAEDETYLGVSTGRKSSERQPGLVFVFPGQGSQWLGMGRELLKQEPAFRQMIERCEAAMQAHVDWSLQEQLLAEAADSRLNEIDIIQPTLFALQVSLAALWRSWGIEPDAVIGHSMGEVAAAYVAGALSLEDAARIICRRSQLLRRVSGQGAMAVIGLSMAEAEKVLDGYSDRLSIAVSNSPRSTVLSGDPAALEELLAKLTAQNIFCRPIKVDVASHSPQMDPLRGDLLQVLEGVQPQAAPIPIYSTVTGEISDGSTFEASYWVRNLRQPVLFGAMVQQLLETDHSVFVEVSAHPILLPAIEETFQSLGKTGQTVASLRREQPEGAMMLQSLGALYTLGYSVAWQRLYPAGRQLSLPAYPWQHERFWLETDFSQRDFTSPHATLFRQEGERHPLLGRRLDLAAPESYIWETELDKGRLPYLYDHRLQGSPLLAASAYLELALAAGGLAFEGQACVLADLTFQRPLFLAEEGPPTRLQVTLSPAADGYGFQFRVYSRAGESWLQHLNGKLYPEDPASLSETPRELPGVEVIQARCAREMSGQAFYEQLQKKGAQIGASLQHVAQLWLGTDELLARIDVSEPLATGAEAYRLHPAISDACFQLSAAVLPSFSAEGGLEAPTGWDQVRVYGPPTPRMWSYIRLREGAEKGVEDIWLLDEAGRVLVEISGFRLKQADESESLLPQNMEEWLYELQWQPLSQTTEVRGLNGSGAHEGSWLIFADRTGVGERLAAQFSEKGARCVLVFQGERYEQVGPDRFTIQPEQLADVQRLLATILTPQGGEIGLVHLWSLDAPGNDDLDPAALEAAQMLSCGSALHLVQALAEREWPIRPRLWLVTRGAQPVLPTSEDISLAQASLWGFGRVIAVEHPELWGGLIDLDPAGGEIVPSLQAMFSQADENQLALREGKQYALRLVRAGRSEAQERPLPARWRPDSSYLITGGLGDIGLQVAQWLIEQGARRLILMGRSQIPPRSEWAQVEPDSPLGAKIQGIRNLEALGATIHCASIDVADEAQLKEFLKTFQQEGWPPIRGIIHAAAVIEDKLLLKLDLAALKKVLRPKVIGSWLLHRLCGEVDHFLLFSSVGSVLGQAGQGNYAAANAFLDALAFARRAQRQAGTSLNWGAWAGLGFAVTAGGQQTIKNLIEQGIGSFTPAQGLDALGRVVGRETAQAVVMPVNWSRFRQTRPTNAKLPLLSQLLAESEPAQPGEERPKAVQKTVSLVERLLAEAPEARRESLQQHVRTQVAQVLKLPVGRVDPDKPLGSFGFDSLMSIELRNRLNASLGLTLPATLTWNYPTVASLAGYLFSRLEPLWGETETSAPATTAAPEPAVGVPAEDDLPLDNLLADIEELSEEEALKALLNKK